MNVMGSLSATMRVFSGLPLTWLTKKTVEIQKSVNI